jgi:hypothetical protein
LFVVYAVPTLVSEYSYTRSAEHTAEEEYEQSKRVAPFGPATQGQYANPEAYRDEWRAERDLRAQQSMAWWAIISAVTTLVGVLLLAATLFETWKAGRAAAQMVAEARRTTEASIRAAQSAYDGAIAAENSVKAATEANAIAREMGQAQVRAYVTVSEAAVRLGDSAPIIRCKLLNSGNSPALRLEYTVSVSLVIMGSGNGQSIGDGNNAETGIIVGVLAPNGVWEYDLHVGSTPIPDECQALIQQNYVEVAATITVSYRDVFKIDMKEIFEFSHVLRKPEPGVFNGLSPHRGFVSVTLPS